MAIPDYQSCMTPLLQLVSNGESISLKDAIESLASQFDLSDEEREQFLPSGGQTVFANRVSWARSYMKQAGLLKTPKRGMLQITEEGRRVLESGEEVDTNFLKRYPSFVKFQEKTSAGTTVPTGPTPDTLEEYLQEFADIADEWFAERPFATEYWQFMHEFFQPENLEIAEWADIQKLGNHIHSLHSNALARANAFGNPNYPIEQYRETFDKLANGEGSVEERMRWFLEDDTAASKYIGASSLSEIMGHLTAETHVFYNGRDEEAARFLGVDPGFTKGDDTARKFAKFNAAIQPIIEAYKEVVGARTEVPIGIEIDQFFSWLFETKIAGATKKASTSIGAKTGGVRVWEIAPGPNADRWESFKKDAVIAVGWDEISDLAQFKSREAISAELKKQLSRETEPRNDSLALWQFCHEMKPGDIVLAKKGRRALVGVGTVIGDYEYRPDRANYHHVRKVRWDKDGFWKLNVNLTTKTLTDLTPYPEHVAKLLEVVGETVPLDGGQSKGHWWINSNPSYWDVRKCAVGERVIFTSYNEAGNKRQKYKYFQEARIGDEVLAYVSSPVRMLTSRLVVTQELGDTPEGEGVEFELVEHFNYTPAWDELKLEDRLAECEPLTSNQGTLFSVTEGEFAVFLELVEGVVPIEVEPYTIEDAMVELFMPEATFKRILERLRAKKNVILQGPPGVGKTFVAQRIAFALMEEKDHKRVRIVQFHQSYSYEDFVRGFRPSENGGFVLRDGVFFEFCEQARKDDRPHIFVIDEINRGNLSKILGELMMLIEHDKRKPQYGVPLVYRKEDEPEFYVPENVYIVGLMNTADRSLAMVDYALRRRFSFIDLVPAFYEEPFMAKLDEMCGDGLGKRIVEVFQELNAKIAADNDNLGPGFCVGHSYFCLGKNDLLDGPGYKRIIDSEIAPLIREYWFDQPKVADEWVSKLEAIAG
jgi:5-methylcytosine-specific restriction protein B